MALRAAGCLVCAGAAALMAAAAWRGRREARASGFAVARERRLREELEAYAHLDPSLTQGLGEGLNSTEAAKALARRVCRTIAEKSVFTRVTMLLRNAEGRLVALGSVGMDDLTVAALDRWAESVVEEGRGGAGPVSQAPARPVSHALARPGVRNFPISLGEWRQFDREVSSWAMSGRQERRRWRRAIVAPIRTGPGNSSGRMVGALVVCTDGAGFEENQQSERSPRLDRALGPIESLAGRIAIAMENEAMAERLQRAEKLAGLGQLAGGVAHALNNPLTAVVGFAELIAETAAEGRVRRDAGTILLEALKMKETVSRLVEFWRPVTLSDEPVEVAGIVAELAAVCLPRLEERGVRLELVGVEGLAEPMRVRGNRDRLRQMLEQLLNNAAQAIAAIAEVEEDSRQPALHARAGAGISAGARLDARGREPEPEERGHTIRIALTHDEERLHLIVSDTGPGFREPGRAFDPFYTTREVEHGAGLGLSICFGIVREHGGVISAFNLHPRGAAVVVDLPLGHTVQPESVVVGSAEVVG